MADIPNDLNFAPTPNPTDTQNIPSDLNFSSDTTQPAPGTSGIFGITQSSPELGLSNTIKDPKTVVQNIGNNAVKNTTDEVTNAFNIQNTTFQDFSDQQNKANDFGFTGVMPEDFTSGFVKDTAMQVGKGIANVPVGTASMIGNIGTFLWNANVHPIKTLETVASDPVGFVAGLAPDSAKQLLAGVFSAGKDAFNGDWSKAGGDINAGVQRGWTAFLDNPVQEILKYSLIGDLLEAPAMIGEDMKTPNPSAGTKGLGNVPGNAANMVKSIYSPYSAAFDVAKTGVENIKTKGVAEGTGATVTGLLTDVSNTLKSTFDTVRTASQMFTQGGRAMILAGQAKSAFDLTKSEMNITDYESKLQAMDKNTPEAQQLQIKLDQANMDKEAALKNFSGMQYTIANSLNKALGLKYNDISSVNADLESNLSGSMAQKDASYQKSLFKPDGSPIQIDNIHNFTDTLRQRADTLGLNTANGADSADLRTFASGLDLRQEISSAGGLQQYIDAEVGRRLNAKGDMPPAARQLALETMKDSVTKEIYGEMKKSGLDVASFDKPLTAQNLQQIWSSYIKGNRLGETNSRSHFIFTEDKLGASADTAFQDTMKENLTRDNPNGYKDFQSADSQYKDLLKTKVFENKDGSPKTFMSVKEFTDFATNHWDAVQKLDPQTQIKIEQSIASQLLNEAIDNKTQTVNTDKLAKSFAEYKNYLKDIPQVRQALNENTIDLSKLATNNPELKAQISTLYGKGPEQINTEQAGTTAKTAEIAKTEEQLKTAQAAQKTVGTDPQEILAKAKGIKSKADLDAFLANSTVKDPIEIGKLITQDIFERNNPDMNKLESGNILKTYEEIQKLYKDSSPTVKKSFFPPAEQLKIDTAIKMYQNLQKLEGSVGKTPTASTRGLQAIGTAVTAMLGWHFQTIRFAFHLLTNPPSEVAPTLNLSDYDKILADKDVPAKTKGLVTKIRDDSLLLSTGYANTKKQ